MPPSIRRRACLLASACLAICIAPSATAQFTDYPNRPITLVLPYQPGSGTDQVARLMAQRMSSELKVPVLVENKAGGNGFIAATQVARAAPDGYTLLLTGNTTHAANQHMFKQLPYDPVKDFTPVSLVYKGFMVMLVNPASNAKTLPELIALAKQSPGKLSFGSGSATGRIAAELMNQMAGLKTVNVPYKSNPQGLTDLMGRQIDFMFTDGPTAVSQVQAGKLRALAVTSPHRLNRLPETPSMAESGFPGYEVAIWTALYLPAGASPVLTKRLNGIVRQVLAGPEMRQFEMQNVTEIVPSSPEELAAFQASETVKTGRVLQAAGMQPE